jgi:hypothetical protein
MKTTGKVVIALIVIGAVVSLVTLFSGSRPVGSENLVGKPLPDFAAPLAGSGIELDSNIYTPAQAKANRAKPACAVVSRGSFNSCKGLKGLAILVFWNSHKADCVRQVDELQKVLARRPRVNAVAVAFENNIDDVTAAASQHHWKLPVAVDRDGAVSSLYAVTGCPSVFFIRDGEIRGVKLGLQSAVELSRQLDRYSNG